MTRYLSRTLAIAILCCVVSTAAGQSVAPPATPLVPPASGPAVYGPGGSNIGTYSSSNPSPATSAPGSSIPGSAMYGYGSTTNSTSVWSTGCQLTAAGPDDPVGDDIFGGHFVAGGGSYWIHPSFTTNPAYSESSRVVVNFAPTTHSVQDFRYGMDLAPEIWLGYVTNSGFGVRVRWWQFDQGSGENLVNNGTLALMSSAPQGLGITSLANHDVFQAYSDLKITVWDFDATQSVRAGCWDLLFGAGGRYCFMAQDYRASFLNTNVFPTVNDGVLSGHNFTGGGPTFSFESHRNFGDTGLAFYSKARTSFLYGNAHEEAVLSESTGTPVPAVNVSATNHMSLMPVGELEIGAEYGYELGRARLFAQAGLVGQVWWGAGNASDTTSGLATDNSSNLGFIGMVFRAGVTY